MKITLEVNRRKDKEQIVENFSVHPQWHRTFDTQLSLYYVLWKLTHDLGLGEHYKLIERKEFSNHIINVYEYEKDKPVPKLNDRFEFIYIPTMGVRTCSKCIHKRLLKDQKHYCNVRGKKLKRDYWHKCDFWQEIFHGKHI